MIKKKTFLKKIIYTFFAIIIFENLSFAKDIYEITAKKVKYNDSKNMVIAEGDALAVNGLGKKVSSDKMVYYKNKNLIETFGSSKFEDGKIILTANNFKYDIEIKTIEANENVTLIDEEKNKYLFSFFKYLENEERGFGDNMKAYLNDGYYLESEKGQTNNKTEITKLSQVKFTTCSNIVDKDNKFCPTWSMKSSSTTHNKKEKKIIHKNAFLRIKNVPILYSPYFSHPDPSVKRQSGILPPLIKTISNIGKTFRVPYFWAITDDKDLTITPIYYFDEKNSILTSYRQAYSNGFLQIENGYSGGYKKLDEVGRTNGSRNFVFIDYAGIEKNLIFSENEINFKIERVSQENFLRVNKINGELFTEDIRNLENSFQIISYDNSKRLELRAGIFENMDIDDGAKYTYFLPDGSFSYNFPEIKKINLNLNTYFQGKKFEKNQKQLKIRNLISADSQQFTNSKIGLASKLKVNLFNKNIYNNNVSGLKENENIDNFVTLAAENSMPFGKFNKLSYQTLTPKVFLKYTTGSQLNAFDNSKVLNYSDVFSMNRTNDLDIPETGFSLGHGIEYLYNKKNIDNRTSFKANTGIAQVIRTSREDNLPNSSSLNNKSSDYAGFLNLNLYGKKTEFFNLDAKKFSFAEDLKQNSLGVKYNYNLSNDLKKLNRNSLSVEGALNGLYSSVDFDEKNSHIGNERFATLELKKMLSESHYLRFKGKKNLKNNNSEYHNISINFENDCINTALTLSREFYYDQDIKTSKSLILSISIKPFSDDFSPDITSFIN